MYLDMTRKQERQLDRIDVNDGSWGPIFDDAYAVHLNTLFEGKDTRAMLEGVLLDRLAGEVAVVSSFGAESAVLLHLIAQVDPATPVLFLETGKHFKKTLEYRDLLMDRLGMTGLINLAPDPVELARKDESGLRWSYDPDGCCEIRKVKPLAKGLAGFDASITGRKGFQSATRAGLPRFEIDRTDLAGRLKINPLADWSAQAIAEYLARHELPAHPLVADGFLSIGCEPCTSKVAPGEDPRSGRWRGWDKTECGIHVPGEAEGAGQGAGPGEGPGDLPPDYEPVF